MHIIDNGKKFPEFDNHKYVARIENKDLNVVGFIAIHLERGTFPSLGATRVWAYATEEEALRDSLRLARLMSYKSAFADLPYGGAKAALTIQPDKFPPREELFAWYAEQVNELGGKFVTGSDVGVSPADVSVMRKHSNFIIGDSVNAGYYTGVGVFYGIQAALQALHGSSALGERTFAIQGLGKTGLEVVRLLYGKAKKIIASDVNAQKIAEALKEFPDLVIVDPEAIHGQEVDMFSPCALRHSINSTTIDLLRCKAVVGSANNQIESNAIEEKLHQKGILYGVDYIVNNGGLISVVDQYENTTADDGRIMSKLLSIKDKLNKIFEKSRSDGLSPGVVANRLVEEILHI